MERADLERFALRLRAVVPAPPAEEVQTAALIAGIERRSLRTTQNRRWAASAALAVVVAGALGRFAPRSEESAAAPIATAAHGLRVENHDSRSALVDLGGEVGRALARPGTRLAYDRDQRRVRLDAGALLIHALPAGRGLSVVAAGATTEVTGTLFAVDGASGEARVWHGSIRTQRPGLPAVELRGSEAWSELDPEELRLLGFTPPPAERPRSVITAPTVEDAADVPLALVLRAQAELAAGRAAEARRLLEDYRQASPEAPLAEEVDLLLLRAAAALGDERTLMNEARRFLERHPGSSRAAEVLPLAGPRSE